MGVRAIWYSNGCPSLKKLIENNLISPDENGKTPTAGIILHWHQELQWELWKDEMNAQLSLEIEKRLMTERMKLIKEQLDQSGKVRKKAFEEIEAHGFDTSAAAVRAFFDAMTEERGLLQINKVIAELAEKDTSALQKEMRELAERAGVTILNGEVKIEEDSAESLDT